MNIAIALTTMILGASYLLGALGYPVIQIVPWSIISISLSTILLVLSVFEIANRGYLRLVISIIICTMQVKPSIYFIQNAGVVSLMIDKTAVPISPWFALPHIVLFVLTLTHIMLTVKQLRKNKLDEEDL